MPLASENGYGSAAPSGNGHAAAAPSSTTADHVALDLPLEFRDREISQPVKVESSGEITDYERRMKAIRSRTARPAAAAPVFDDGDDT